MAIIMLAVLLAVVELQQLPFLLLLKFNYTCVKVVRGLLLLVVRHRVPDDAIC